MLEMQREDERSLFMAMNQAAADYYARHDPESALSRRERAYHLLMLDGPSPLSAVEALDRDDLLALASAVDELPPRARAVVRALLGQGLMAKERQTLPDVVWSTYAYRRGLALLAAGTPEEAISILRERPRLVDQGPAKYPLALALFNLLDWKRAKSSLVSRSIRVPSHRLPAAVLARKRRFACGPCSRRDSWPGTATTLSAQ